MANCRSCGALTQLYVRGIPTCGPCSDDLDGLQKPQLIGLTSGQGEVHHDQTIPESIVSSVRSRLATSSVIGKCWCCGADAQRYVDGDPTCLVCVKHFDAGRTPPSLQLGPKC